MKVTATDLVRFGIVDEVVPEPPGGAHSDPETLFRTLEALLERQLSELAALPADELVARRHEKFRRMGAEGREFTVAPA
jgi:acetyl-CoA carboxylase alpha subunit